MKVLLVNRFESPRHRSVDNLVLERRVANRAVPPIVLLDPDALHGRCLIASTAQPFVQVPQVLIEVRGLLRGRSPIDPRGTRLARAAVCFPQTIFVDPVGEGGTHAMGIAGGLCRNALEFWGDGW
jgi:hypothetical protein